MVRALSLSVVGLALAGPVLAAPAGEEVERVVAVIRSPASPEPRVITLTRVEEEARIALVSRGAVLAATRALDGPALKAGLEWLVDQTLLMDEATRLQVFEIDSPDALAELARFKARFSRAADYEAFLDRCDLSEEDLEAVLLRMLRVKRYVESRVSHAAQVPEAEVSAWLDQHAAELGTRDRDAARAHLAEARVSDEVKALVHDLRGRAEVRVLDDVGARTAAEPVGAGAR